MKKLPAALYACPGIYVLTIAALLFTNTSSAEPIYKSTNAQGEVIFSDNPPPNAVDVEQVKVRPAPTDADQQESMERVKRMESRANEMGTARQERSQQPSEPVPQTVEEFTGAHTTIEYDDEQRRRRAIVEKRREAGVEHRAPAGTPPRAGGGGRGR